MATLESFLEKSPARLVARPAVPQEEGQAGLHVLPISSGRRALLHVPKGSISSGPAAFAVMLHGAGGSADGGLDILTPYADRANVIVLAPESRQSSWDIISDSQYGPDVRFIDECLQFVFSHYRIDPSRLALGGFSDGASYALSLGLSNGTLFTNLLAFSPGFLTPAEIQGSPSIFMCHGTQDEVLPIDRCSRRLVRVLRNQQLNVEYREFGGPHTVPADCRQRATEALTQT